MRHRPINERKTPKQGNDSLPATQTEGVDAVAPVPTQRVSPISFPVVPFARDHIPGIHACLDAFAQEQRHLAFTEAPNLEQVASLVEQSIANDVAQFVALAGEFLVGWADILPASGQSVSHCGRLGMGILPGYRGLGIGTRLLQACLDKAEVQGLTRIELEARSDNAAGIGLYEKFGFVREAVKLRAMKYDGRYYNTVQMSLLLEREHSN